MEENFDRDQRLEFSENVLQDQFCSDDQEEIITRQSKKDQIEQKLRFSSGRIGWATAILVSVWLCLMVFISIVAGVIDYTFGGVLPFSATAFYNQYVLLFNEISLGIAIALAVLLLFPVPKENFENGAVEFPFFLKSLLICFGVGYLGNLIGTFFLSLWNGFTGNSVGNELQTVLSGINPMLLFLCSVILAPILEELFFRKFLIDRLRPFGRNISVLLPAFLFGLFHQSVEQLLYAFLIGTILSYFYYKTGKYWLSVAIHAIFNWISGFIPMQFLPKLNSFANDMVPVMENLSETATMDEITEQMLPLLETYGTTIVLYVVYLLLLFAVNITGVVLFCIHIKKIRENTEERVLSASETFKSIMLNPGMIVCTVFLGGLTILSLFS